MIMENPFNMSMSEGLPVLNLLAAETSNSTIHFQDEQGVYFLVMQYALPKIL